VVKWDYDSLFSKASFDRRTTQLPSVANASSAIRKIWRAGCIGRFVGDSVTVRASQGMEARSSGKPWISSFIPGV